MEVALARLVGAGLTLVFEGFEEPAPAGAVENGFLLIQHIARERPDAIELLTHGVIKDIWREWRQARLPQDVAVAHVEAMPTLMEQCRANEGMMLGAVAAIQVAKRTGATARIASHTSRVATSIIGQAIESGFLTARSLNESIAFFFLDRLLTRLMPDQQLFLDLRPQFRSYVERAPWLYANTDAALEAPAAAAEPTIPAQSELPALDIARAAADHNAPEPALSALANATALALGACSPARLDEIGRGLRQLLDALEKTTDAKDSAADLKRQAAGKLAAGETGEADQLMADAEDVHLKAAPQDLASAQSHLVAAAAIRALRADLALLAADFRRAARHHASAARCLPEADRKGRRDCLMQQASVLSQQGDLGNDTAALSEAAQIYAEAGRLLSEQDAPSDWASAHLDLGNVLMVLGEREGRPERFLAAALHFKPAADVFSKLKQTDNWARAQLGIADALRSQGEVQGDIVTLSEAAFAYRAALGVASRDRMPAEWRKASYRLAVTLMRLDHESGDTTHHDEAVMSLRAVIAAGAVEDGPDPVRANAMALLAEGLLALSKARVEPWLADEAVTLIREGHLAVVRAPAGQRASLDDRLGTLLCILGESQGSAELIAEATDMKLSALDQFTATGDLDSAERVRGELRAIEEALQQMSVAPPGPAVVAVA